jgi:hypothetical protein
MLYIGTSRSLCGVSYCYIRFICQRSGLSHTAAVWVGLVSVEEAVRVEEALDKKHMEVLTLLALLVQMYKY